MRGDNATVVTPGRYVHKEGRQAARDLLEQALEIDPRLTRAGTALEKLAAQ